MQHLVFAQISLLIPVLWGVTWTYDPQNPIFNILNGSFTSFIYFVSEFSLKIGLLQQVKSLFINLLLTEGASHGNGTQN